MKFLLDTCAALWWWQDSEQLSERARFCLADHRNLIHFSAVSAMEIATKQRLGKLKLTGRLAANLTAAVSASGWLELPLNIADAQLAGQINWNHRDPFDRLLVAQAIAGNFKLISCDPSFKAVVDLELLW